jgi:hypothetical protein
MAIEKATMQNSFYKKLASNIKVIELCPSKLTALFEKLNGLCLFSGNLVATFLADSKSILELGVF